MRQRKSICQVGLETEGGPCNMEIAGKYPTNLKSHLKAMHPCELAELTKKDSGKDKDKEGRKSHEGVVFSTTAKLTIVDAVARMKKASTLGKVSGINAWLLLYLLVMWLTGSLRVSSFVRCWPS